MNSRLLLALPVLLLSTAAQSADEPKWLKDARARESKPIDAREFKSKDNWLKAKVPAKAVGVIEKDDGAYAVELDIGAAAPVYCQIVVDGFDMADTMRQTQDLIMSQVEQAQGKIEMRALERVDAGAYGNVPYLSTQWVYTANDGKGARVGGFKQVAMSKNGQGLYCAHVDLGYVKTFEAVATALAASFESASAPPPPFYLEIGAMTLGDFRVGVAITTLEDDGDGVTAARQTTSMLMPSGPGKVHSQDVIHKEFIRADASLINAVQVVAENGDLTSNLALSTDDDGVWVIKGDMQGKAVSVKLAKDAKPGTWVGQARELRTLLTAADAAGREHSMTMWQSSDPGKLTDIKTKVIAKIDNKQYSALGTVGALKVKLKIDAPSGMATFAEMQMGPQAVKMETVYVSGTF